MKFGAGARQSVELMPPSTGVTRLTGHSLHLVDPTSGEYWLSGQSWQASDAPFMLNEPGSHLMQADAPTSAEKVPGAQLDATVAAKALTK